MTAKTILCRAQQAAVGLGGRFLRWPRPVCITGPGSLRRLPALLREAGVKKPLIVASRRQCAAPSFAAVAEGLGEYVTFSDVPANPPVETVEAVAALYRRSGCDGFVAIGGGSPMDAAKAAAARIARPDRTVAQMGGLMKVGRTIPPFIAVPTTAGTGSETTMAAVVTGADHHKYALGDLHLIPRYAILDPALTVSLPPDITAQTGMDALTHAVEAYCNRFYNTNQTRRLAEEAAADIFRYLPIACANGDDLEAREKLLTASFHAGCAFTRAGVGNVHAIAHTLGGLYGVGHGLRRGGDAPAQPSGPVRGHPGRGRRLCGRHLRHERKTGHSPGLFLHPGGGHPPDDRLGRRRGQPRLSRAGDLRPGPFCPNYSADPAGIMRSRETFVRRRRKTGALFAPVFYGNGQIMGSFPAVFPLT